MLTIQYNCIHINASIIISLNFHTKIPSQAELYLACIQGVCIAILRRSNGCMDVSAWFSFPLETVMFQLP
jgi:hypothetical protein